MSDAVVSSASTGTSARSASEGEVNSMAGRQQDNLGCTGLRKAARHTTADQLFVPFSGGGASG